MRRTVAFWMLAIALTATTLAWAGDTAGPGAACPPECTPCPSSCATACPLGN
jgi:hypothetical protein